MLSKLLVINEISPACSDVGEVFRPSLLLFVYSKQIVFLEGYEKCIESSPKQFHLLHPAFSWFPFFSSFFPSLSILPTSWFFYPATKK